MSVLNFKRLSIEELNILAGKIIDELSTRDSEEKPLDNLDFIENICTVYEKKDKLGEELYLLETKKELIEDEIDRIQEILEGLESEEENIMYKYNIGVLK